MSPLESAPVHIELASAVLDEAKIQILLADDGSAQIVRVAPNGDRSFYPIWQFDFPSALADAKAILTGERKQLPASKMKCLAAAFLLLNRQLEETHALLRAARAAETTVEPL